MSGQSSTSQQPPLHFMLDVIILEVKSASKTHGFLCDAFGKAEPAANWPNDKAPPPQGSQLSQDGMHAVFRLGNTRIQFSQATSSEHSVEGNKAKIAVCVKDIDKVKKLLDKRGVSHKFGQWKALPGMPWWVEFKDQDGYGWNVSELVKG